MYIYININMNINVNIDINISIEIIVLIDRYRILSILATKKPLAEPMQQPNNIILFIYLFILHLVTKQIKYDQLSLGGG